MAASLARVYSCNVELALEILAGKWKPVILAHLKEGALRYGELRALIRAGHRNRLSDKMLSQRLADLEEQGLIERRKRGGRGAPSIYRLTSRAEGLRPALQALHDWGAAMAPEVGAMVLEPTRVGSTRARG
jgi:DNA-binding HxlR family transcriptional regulator